jgi:hypothetical protein
MPDLMRPGWEARFMAASVQRQRPVRRLMGHPRVHIGQATVGVEQHQRYAAVVY